ncbi:acyl-homoserine-lactone synthase TraI [Rhizobium sp. Leaf386]|uniref:acyl-homoserine-lactone synthase n=1 Tax=Rhizobium sp. Leaf386 TaxID=1736359 RepID=UPI0007162F38|nr:acyl-homoserine-lactone synthase TraI [Rhizobium sp. Leaf386]KQS95584.1 autoinducer synthesis protein [Rhizobium sp. Leaf386]
MIVTSLSNPISDRQLHLMDAMHRLRQRVFGERLAWDVVNDGGRESDEFDLLNPTYIVALSAASEIAGCVRLLPATGPTMLERTFPQLLASGRLNAHPAMIESSRFCVDTTLVEGRGGKPLHDATMAMFAGIIEWCMIRGFTEIVTATDVRFERILNRAAWPMRRLGQPTLINETMSVAGILPVDRASFDRIRPANYRSDFNHPEQQAE